MMGQGGLVNWLAEKGRVCDGCDEKMASWQEMKGVDTEEEEEKEGQKQGKVKVEEVSSSY